MHDAVIMRTVIDIPDEVLGALTEICRHQNISRAEAVRRALREMLAVSARGNRDKAFGAWKRKIDSRAFVDTLRTASLLAYDANATGRGAAEEPGVIHGDDLCGWPNKIADGSGPGENGVC